MLWEAWWWWWWWWWFRIHCGNKFCVHLKIPYKRQTYSGSRSDAIRRALIGPAGSSLFFPDPAAGINIEKRRNLRVIQLVDRVACAAAAAAATTRHPQQTTTTTTTTTTASPPPSCLDVARVGK
ncbi:hypothetical protein ECANGB1_2736 [Enterospora canceri]|uniref:Secreted protein n=1 Tax=Enterospora canceri TaxID=1081671 RepID=A0A1Y1S4C2_9MICR|nr:hypothetical protein ECANGB1_2736 [Enterospora canceri]